MACCCVLGCRINFSALRSHFVSPLRGFAACVAPPSPGFTPCATELSPLRGWDFVLYARTPSPGLPPCATKMSPLRGWGFVLRSRSPHSLSALHPRSVTPVRFTFESQTRVKRERIYPLVASSFSVWCLNSSSYPFATAFLFANCPHAASMSLPRWVKEASVLPAAPSG